MVPAIAMTRQQKIKLLIRRTAAQILFYTGLNAIYRLLRNRDQAIILMYHRVLETAGGDYVQPGMYVTRKTFEMHMKYLRARYRVLPLNQLVAGLERGRLEKSTCVITFDDGWRDTYTTAFPILRNFSLPAVVFLVSEFVGTNRCFWPDAVGRLLMGRTVKVTKQDEVLYPTIRDRGILPILAASDGSSTVTVDAVIEILKSLEASERDKAVHELEELTGGHILQQADRPLLAAWSEIGEMNRAGVTLGSHTKSHALLTKVSRHEATEQIVESQQKIEEKLGKPCTAFCYPNGDMNEDIKAIVKTCYKAAVTTWPGPVRVGDDQWALRRIAIHDDGTFTKALFACRISGLLNVFGL